MLHNTTSSKEAAIVMGYYAKKTKTLLSALQQATSAAPDAPAQAKKVAVANAPTDVLELPNIGTLVITVDVPGASHEDVKVRMEGKILECNIISRMEDGELLVVSGEQRRAADDEGVMYLRMERRVGKFVRKFPLPETANLDSISAAYKERMLPPPPPEPKKRKTIEVKAG